MRRFDHTKAPMARKAAGAYSNPMTGGFSFDAWSARVGYDGPLRPTEDALTAVQRAQLQAIPFENFDILLGRGVSLDPAALAAKLLHQRRGGYCFELNAVFLMALDAIGFQARPLLARVQMRGTPSGRTHQLVHVTIGGRAWIADVGFGGPGMRDPMPLELDVTRRQDGLSYRLVDGAPYGTMLRHEEKGEWRNLYSFDLGHVCQADIDVANHYTATHPASFFTYARVAARHTPEGRVALLDRSLRRIANGAETVEELPDGTAWPEILETHFGIVLDAPCESLPPLPAPSGGPDA
jgi:N-hydroxyarylamine O-acetyltransferase